MRPCRLMNCVVCSTTTGWIFSAHLSWENGKSKKTDESHRSPNHAATSRTALPLLNFVNRALRRLHHLVPGNFPTKVDGHLSKDAGEGAFSGSHACVFRFVF